jgi:hypothetical protein
MKKIALPLLIFALMILACSLTPSPVTEPPVTEPPATEPPVTEPPVTEPPVTEPPVMTNVTCNELSLYLDPALASSYDCQTVPESPYEMELYPAHTELTLLGYPLADKFFEPHISVYPVAAYTALAPAVIPGRVTQLQTIVAGGHNPLYTGSSTPALPFLPLFNAAQAFYIKGKIQPFASGIGIRFSTEYAQYYVPVNNTDLFYTFQGLTNDGQYWISAILPVNHPLLPPSADPLPGGASFEDFANNYETYITDMVSQLNDQPPESFTPSLLALDVLVSSITIAP